MGVCFFVRGSSTGCCRWPWIQFGPRAKLKQNSPQRQLPFPTAEGYHLDNQWTVPGLPPLAQAAAETSGSSHWATLCIGLYPFGLTDIAQTSARNKLWHSPMDPKASVGWASTFQQSNKERTPKQPFEELRFLAQAVAWFFIPRGWPLHSLRIPSLVFASCDVGLSG